MPVETYKEKLDYNKAVGTIDLGSYVLLIYPRQQGGYFFRPFKSNRTDIVDKTRDLAPNTVSVFAGLDPDLLEMLEVGAVLAPQVSWRSSSGVLEEAQLTVSGTDAFEFKPAKAILYDNEITDMFTKPAGGKDFKAASLIFLNTSIGDIMGIAIHRNSPIVLLITPSIEGSRASSKEGLNNLLSGILGGLTSKITTFETQVLNALAEATANGYFQLPYDSTTLGGKLQNNLLMQVYTAKTFFLARKAEVSGKGMNEPELLEHFPYLKTIGKKSGIAGLLAAAGGPKSLKIEPSLWDQLVEDGSRGISLKNPHDKTPRPRNIKPLQQRGIKINVPQGIMSADEVAALKHRQAPATPVKVEPVISPETKLREESVNLAKPTLEKMAASLGSFTASRPEKLTQADLAATVDRLKKIIAELKKITAAKKKGRPPVTGTPIDLMTKKDALKMFGVLTSQKALDFLVPVNNSDFASAIEKSTQRWTTDSNFQDTKLRSDPKARLAATLLSSSRLAPLAEHLKSALNLRDIRMINQAIDLVNTTYYILVEKTIYLLLQAGEQLCQKGQETEINNWAHYSQAAIERLINLAEQIK